MNDAEGSVDRPLLCDVAKQFLALFSVTPHLSGQALETSTHTLRILTVKVLQKKPSFGIQEIPKLS